jgi:thymidylate synthase ThyX
MIRRLAAKESAELQELIEHIYRLAKEVAPSIILFTEASPFDARTYGELEETAESFLAGTARRPKKKPSAGRSGEEAVSLADATPDGDDRILAAILHTSSAEPYERCLRTVRWMTPAQKSDFIKTALRRQEFYDFPLREFEYAGLTFSLVVSASCFAQLKRHRMATLTCQRYDPVLGVTVPPTIEEVGAGGDFRRVIEQTEEAYALINKRTGPEVAAYVLTNAHRRRVLLQVNVRELYHISRLREDPSAQWEIREAAGAMSALARKEMPLSCLLLGGKDRYPGIYRKVFGSNPKMSPPRFLK